MPVGTKDYYVDGIKRTLMTNSVANESISLLAILRYYEEEIRSSPNLVGKDKESYKRNLQKAFDQTKDEVFGKIEE
ncbi:hypothetical protein OR571_04295 [Psychrobacillus sp. NEAU-3TGS]|uniref:hypothetical protein n=1 Tax=Psychrobacillus sp. NEAU-3TGS TaxID=2995412 RepID=UPI00249906D3|nr:hypothetical protein [Psychrobacillus sp. NEAU-3TGS]MDI2586370.1 hypothetical protein [Psychrobacillus sp. NEAU-3TGS]